MASFVKVLYENLSSPAKNVLQSINDNSLRLDNQEEDTLYYMVANIIWVKKGGENCHWTRDIIPVQQGDQEHYGRQIEVEACAAISKTEN